MRRLVEEDSSNGQGWVGALGWPRRIRLDVLANQGDVAFCVGSCDIAKQSHVVMSGELGNLTGIVRIRQGIGAWTAARIDDNCEVDIWVGRYTVAFSSCSIATSPQGT